MDYAFSPDLGVTWLNNWNQVIGNLADSSPILPASPGITIFSIPKFGFVPTSSRVPPSPYDWKVVDCDVCRGILNQEAQAVDRSGRIHVLNRENTTGTEQWYAYSSPLFFFLFLEA